jgi:hypothetical protein
MTIENGAEGMDVQSSLVGRLPTSDKTSKEKATAKGGSAEKHSRINPAVNASKDGRGLEYMNLASC